MYISGLNVAEYDKNNSIHKSFMKRITQLPQVESEYYNYEEYISTLLMNENNKAYIVSVNSDIFAIVCLLKEDEEYYISYIMDPSKNTETMEIFMLDLFTSYIFFAYHNISELSLQENHTNNAFRVVAAKCGYDSYNNKYVRKRDDLYR